MKNLKIISIAIVLSYSIILISCVQTSFNTIGGNGNIIKKELNIKDFQEVEASGAFKIYLIQGSINSISIETDENLMEYISIRNQSNRLIIETHENIKPSKEAIIYLTFIDISSFDISGACEVIGENHLKFKKIEMEISGAAELSVDMEAAETEFDLSGASDIKLIGKSNMAIIDASGASEISAKGFVINNCIVDLSGASTAHLNVNGDLNVSLSGASSLNYYGDAKILRKEIFGDSSITNNN